MQAYTKKLGNEHLLKKNVSNITTRMFALIATLLTLIVPFFIHLYVLFCVLSFSCLFNEFGTTCGVGFALSGIALG